MAILDICICIFIVFLNQNLFSFGNFIPNMSGNKIILFLGGAGGELNV